MNRRARIVVEGSSAAEGVAAAEAAGLQVGEGWALPVQPWILAGSCRLGEVADRAEAAEAVRAVVRCDGIIALAENPAAADLLAADLRRLDVADWDAAADGPDPLTAEQRALLDAVATGATLPEAAAALFLSVRTAERRLSQIRRALGVGSTAEAIAVRHGRTARNGGVMG